MPIFDDEFELRAKIYDLTNENAMLHNRIHELEAQVESLRLANYQMKNNCIAAQKEAVEVRECLRIIGRSLRNE